MKKIHTINILVPAILFITWIYLWWYVLGHQKEGQRDNSETISSETNAQTRQSWWYAYINPLIECEIQNLGSQQKYIPFERKLREKIEKNIIEKNPDIKLSLYFRNLRNGPWFWINDQDEYAPASLMKLPVAMAYLKWIEFEPSIWDKTFTGVLEDGSVQNVQPDKSIIAWSGYSVDELIRYALTYSDNNANRTLLDNISNVNLFRIFHELDLPITTEIEEWKDDYISVKEYASFFRILYNASYLTRVSSEYLLSTMAQTEFTKWIRNAVDPKIPVSHKFGERWYYEQKSGKFIQEFHDCGIVYFDKYPYLLCMMTKWVNPGLEKLEKTIEETAKIVQDTIQETYP